MHITFKIFHIVFALFPLCFHADSHYFHNISHHFHIMSMIFPCKFIFFTQYLTPSRIVSMTFSHYFHNISHFSCNISHPFTRFSHDGYLTGSSRSSHGVWTMLFLVKQRFLWYHGDFPTGVTIGVKMFTKCAWHHRFVQYFPSFSHHLHDVPM